ncbi:hypothetical protein [Arthrobacter woluwensis]|uniref:hypothetical protein n=1 Tax=Arthrobacter woluwensis TaxID=156980 RepID=UPI00119FA552|nr:hypothetical protein [Arthrobacter woluwensis]
MDLTKSIEPRSDQLNADDLMAGPRTYTIQAVTEGNAEQPVNVELVEAPGRPYKPSKSMRRVLAFAWSKDTAGFPGRRITLFRNPDIKFGRDTVGGIEISHLSHIDKPVHVPLTVTRGKRKSFTVQPLTEAPRTDWAAEANKLAGNPDELRILWTRAQGAGATPEELEHIKEVATRG